MHIVFNFTIIIMVFLIAYWWSNQGLFSSLLHMVAVIVAGALTLSIWEFLVWDLALGNTGVFDGYVTGVSFILVFIASLALLRVATDTLIPENLKLPPLVDLVGGFILGAVSGILAIGLLLIGTGFLQRPHEFMGYKGYGRETIGNSAIDTVGPKLWMPVDMLASSFYEFASITGLKPDISGTPLKQYNPELYKQASLLRDTPEGAKGQVYLPTGAVTASAPFISEAGGKRFITVPLSFDAIARDFGRQLVISKSQVRLVGKAYGTSAPEVVYPTYWVQDTKIGEELSDNTAIPGFYRFDDSSNYITSVPGRAETKAKISFEVSESFEPLYIQLKGLRLALEPGQDRDFTMVLAGAQALGAGLEFDDDPGGDITDAIKVSNKLRFLRSISKNKMPSTISESSGYLTEGYMKVRAGKSGRISRGLQLKGILRTEGTNIVQVDISRNSQANLFGQVRKMARPGDTITLLDTEGNSYAPIGYYFRGRDGTQVKLDRRNFVRTLDEIGIQPASGSSQELVLLFEVSTGAVLDSLQVGAIEVGYISNTTIGN